MAPQPFVLQKMTSLEDELKNKNKPKNKDDFKNLDNLNSEDKLGLYCAKLRASLIFSGLDWILVYFDWLT